MSEKEYLDKLNNEQTEIILKLNEQIEKMKCCGNCIHHSFWNTELHCNLQEECIRFEGYTKCREDKWELRK